MSICRASCQPNHAADLWQGHRVKVIDGTGLSMPDTSANQKAYPQPVAQKAVVVSGSQDRRLFLSGQWSTASTGYKAR